MDVKTLARSETYELHVEADPVVPVAVNEPLGVELTEGVGDGGLGVGPRLGVGQHQQQDPNVLRTLHQAQNLQQGLA